MFPEPPVQIEEIHLLCNPNNRSIVASVGESDNRSCYRLRAATDAQLPDHAFEVLELHTDGKYVARPI